MSGGPDISDKVVWQPLLRPKGPSVFGAQPEFASDTAFRLDDVLVKIYLPRRKIEDTP